MFSILASIVFATLLQSSKIIDVDKSFELWTAQSGRATTDLHCGPTPQAVHSTTSTSFTRWQDDAVISTVQDVADLCLRHWLLLLMSGVETNPGPHTLNIGFINMNNMN